jgi:hypothetical protein
MDGPFLPGRSLPRGRGPVRHLRVHYGDIEREAVAGMGFYGRGLRAFSTTSYYGTALTRRV